MRHAIVVYPEVEGHSSAESTNFTLFLTQRNISRGHLHTNRVDSADAENDFGESTVRISDCRASSILKVVPVSEDSKENAMCKHEICPQQYETFI